MGPSPVKGRRGSADEAAVRERILTAGLMAFTQTGYAGTSTLEIASRARVSKRELYKLVGNKQELLAACIGAHAQKMKVPADLPEPRDREALAEALARLGANLLAGITDATVVAVFRLAIAEAVRSPEIAQALETLAIAPIRATITGVMDRARTAKLIAGEPTALAAEFSALLFGDLMVRLLLGVADQPNAGEIARRAGEATKTFLNLHSGRRSD